MEVYIDGEAIGKAYELIVDRPEDIYEGTDKFDRPHWRRSEEPPEMSFNVTLDEDAIRYFDKCKQKMVMSLSEDILYQIVPKSELIVNIENGADVYRYECTVNKRGFKAKKLYLTVNNIVR